MGFLCILARFLWPIFPVEFYSRIFLLLPSKVRISFPDLSDFIWIPLLNLLASLTNSPKLASGISKSRISYTFNFKGWIPKALSCSRSVSFYCFMKPFIWSSTEISLTILTILSVSLQFSALNLCCSIKFSL